MTKSTIHLIITAVVLLSYISCQSPSVRPETHGLYLEVNDHRLYDYVSSDMSVEIIAEGHDWTEGPVWIDHMDALLYSDVPQNKMYIWTADQGAQLYMHPSGYISSPDPHIGSNGLYLDRDGSLLVCRSGERDIARVELPYSDSAITTVLTDRYEDMRYNNPNDIAQDRYGNIYFTDPVDQVMDPDDKDMDYNGLYRMDTLGQVDLLADHWAYPNGVGVSPDGSRLYLTNSNPPRLISYTIDPDGQVSHEQIMMDMQTAADSSVGGQLPDGMDIHSDGTLYVTGPDGVFIITAEGEHLGTIKTDRYTSNCILDHTESILYVTSDDLVYRITL